MPNTVCTRNCWLAGAALGLLVWILAGMGSMRWFEALFLGLIAGGLMGAFLVWALCGGRVADIDHAADRHDARASAAGATAGPRAAVRSGIPAGAKPAPQRPAASPSRAAPARAQTGSAAKPAAAESPAMKPKTSPAPAAGTAAEPASKAPAKQDAAGPKPDDLKKIRGIGGKMERLLNDHGVTRFAQIAAWTEADKDRFAGLVGQLGSRIRSEDWPGQARTLAAGGETAALDRGE